MKDFEAMTKFIQHKQAEGLSQATIESYCYALRHYYQWQCKNNIETATEDDTASYMASIRDKYSPVTIRDKFAVLHAFYSWCEQHGIRHKSPMTTRKPPLPVNRARCFTDEEIAKIMRHFATRDTFCKVRDYAIVCLLFATGIRRGELLSLQTVQRDFLTVTGKGNRTRCVPVSASLRVVLMEYIKQREKIAQSPFLIVTRDGHQMTKNGLRAVFSRLSQATGIGGRRFSCHTWRHTYATQFLRHGGDISSLCRILGHSDISTTSIYTHWDDDSVKKINEKFNPLNRFKIII